MSFSISFNQNPAHTLGNCFLNQSYSNCKICNCSKSNILDLNDVAKDFCNIYYSNTVNGFSSVLDLFEPNANCNYCGKECKGMYEMMVMLGSDGISSMRYDNLNGTVIPINEEYMTIQIIGLCQGVTFWNQLTNIREFSETFVLKYNENNKITISSYNFRLV